MNKNILLIIIVVVVIGGAYYFIFNNNEADWVTGEFMDYPSDLVMIPAVEGTRQGPTFTFPDSYFAGSAIFGAEVTSYASCGGESSEPNTTLGGLDLYKSENGLMYILPGACNEIFQLTIESTDTTAINLEAQQNIISIFERMVTSHAEKALVETL